jgi:hypothetical protein
MSRSRRLRRRQAAMDRLLELMLLFLLGFAVSSVIGMALAWFSRRHQPQALDLDEDSRAPVPAVDRRVSWLPPAHQGAPGEHAGWLFYSACSSGPRSGGSSFTLPRGRDGRLLILGGGTHGKRPPSFD